MMNNNNLFFNINFQIIVLWLKDIATHLQVPLLEILKFPHLLHHKRLADLFKRGLIALNVCGCPLKLEELEEKLPGTYLLLVHHDPEVQDSPCIC